VAAGEKRLSHKSASNPGEEALQLHCFPDIPSGDKAACQPREAAIGGFQRLDLSAREADGAVACRNGRNQTTSNQARREKLEQNAYQRGFGDGHQKGLAEGERRGYQAGEQAGFETACQRVEPLIQSLHENLSQLSRLRQELHQQIEHEVVELALSIVGKIICHEAAIGRETVLCVVQEALKHVTDDGRITVKMSPSDLQFMQDAKHGLSGRLSSLQHVDFESDESISSGGCVIETESGKINARLEHQLRAIEESLRSQLPEAPHDSTRPL
jgi:flagellar biosynthesis/type III secretory pathway protein FliH